MSDCRDCRLSSKRCICNAVTEFFEEHGELMRDLAENESSEKAGAAKCAGCAFYLCRCTGGQLERLRNS